MGFSDLFERRLFYPFSSTRHFFFGIGRPEGVVDHLVFLKQKNSVIFNKIVIIHN
jgi:hypothetical protein